MNDQARRCAAGCVVPTRSAARKPSPEREQRARRAGFRRPLGRRVAARISMPRAQDTLVTAAPCKQMAHALLGTPASSVGATAVPRRNCAHLPRSGTLLPMTGRAYAPECRSGSRGPTHSPANQTLDSGRCRGPGQAATATTGNCTSAGKSRRAHVVGHVSGGVDVDDADRRVSCRNGQIVAHVEFDVPDP